MDGTLTGGKPIIQQEVQIRFLAPTLTQASPARECFLNALRGVSQGPHHDRSLWGGQGNLIYLGIYFLDMAGAVKGGEITTIRVPRIVVETLRHYQKSGQSLADVIMELMEEYPSDEFMAEMDRRRREEPRVTLAEFKRSHGFY